MGRGLVSNTSWSEQVPFDVACRRASGRRHYNSIRQCRRVLRRREVARLIGHYGMTHGAQAQIARALGVHRSTICRDFAAILKRLNEGEPCPLCGMDWGDPIECVRQRLLRWP